MKFKILTTVILLNTLILAEPRPSFSQVLLNDSLLAEELKTKDISPNLQIAQTKQRRRYRGNFSQFLLKLGQRETGRSNPPYNIQKSLGFIGKYQFAEALLKDL